MELEWKDIIILAQFAVIALLAFGAHRSVPLDFMKYALVFLKDQAAKTPSTFDDMAVGQLEQFMTRTSTGTSTSTIQPGSITPAG